MVARTSLSQEADTNQDALADCESMAKAAGDGACGEVLLSLCNRQVSGEDTTVWDIHRLTGLALHEAFAALRTLEYGKVVDILDNPADPFGATIRLREEGLGNLRRQSAA
ncbi:hypothetical protein K3152_03415 [Qipengyuania sp. 1NDH17]|uniref:Uncharacterized protein n=1 Tax=Qipengyuania polymorpha TaxID=2867234 RepID=A0ABS7IYY7_9SPHN|nr:hypothetical protein [Qipengyuania polymorpha]MBX7457285.1 hypothetical protein [Qipengyuania polymorpha]